MNSDSQAVIEECARRSQEGSIDFGTVVKKLTAAGVESYHADYRRRETTYYFPGGQSYVAALHPPEQPIPDAFDAGGVHVAVLGAQRGEVLYPEFMRRSMAAGCVGYFVWIAGRHVQYLGRRGEQHVEHFPNDPAGRQTTADS
jgi:uncharacterized protein YbcV (DUF1398 family)